MSMKLFKNKKRLTAYVLAALCVASTGFAATEHWNDASTTPKTVVATQAGDENWEQWKSSWENIKTDFCSRQRCHPDELRLVFQG